LAAVPPVEDEPEDDVLDVVAGAAGVDDELDVELPLEEPQPAISSATSTTLATPGTSDRRRTVRAGDLSVDVVRVIAFSFSSMSRRRSARSFHTCESGLGPPQKTGSPPHRHDQDLSILTPLGFNTYQSEPKPWTP
jgi:hypothetical protein